MFKKKENGESERVARAYFFLQKAMKIMAIIAGVINGALVALMVKDWNGGAILFIINLMVCFALFYKINRENVKAKKNKPKVKKV